MNTNLQKYLSPIPQNFGIYTTESVILISANLNLQKSIELMASHSPVLEYFYRQSLCVWKNILAAWYTLSLSDCLTLRNFEWYLRFAKWCRYFLVKISKWVTGMCDFSIDSWVTRKWYERRGDATTYLPANPNYNKHTHKNDHNISHRCLYFYKFMV